MQDYNSFNLCFIYRAVYCFKQIRAILVIIKKNNYFCYAIYFSIFFLVFSLLLLLVAFLISFLFNFFLSPSPLVFFSFLSIAYVTFNGLPLKSVLFNFSIAFFASDSFSYWINANLWNYNFFLKKINLWKYIIKGNNV